MKTLLLIDANSLIHRCFHALPPLSNKKGEPTGALYGVANILLKIIQSKKPDLAAALFDRPEPTFRKQRFADYKIHRPPTPDELAPQLAGAHKLFESFSIKTLEAPGHEADDLIGTLAQKFKNDTRILILTGDLDSLQLVENGRVIVETFKKGISQTARYDEEAVEERYGIRPPQMIDYKALVGDASDNIPGVPGVGPKTASTILKKYKTLDDFFKKGTKEKIFEKIKRNKDLAILSRELVTINLSVPVKVKLEELVFSPTPQKIERYFEENDFSSLLKRVGAVEKSDTNSETAIPKKLIQNKIPFQGINQEVITIEDDAQLPEKDRLSSKTKIGYDLKDVFKKTFLAPPVFDVKIGLELLEIKTRDWLEACQKILKEKISQKEFLLKSHSWLTKKIKTAGLEKVFYGIEMPLVPVLATMEKNGVLIDREELRSVQTKLTSEIKRVKKEIIKKMGENINLNSPKQLLVYFQKKGLKIKSTSAEKLEKISQNYPLVKEILEYREFFKLKTTYLDSLEKLVENDNRIHPTFLQLGAATGRLSCQNPNLQNIPQESSWSFQIRNVFIAPKNFLLVSFDYSQIELRILAHLTQDQNILAAFKRGEDIHSLTAQKIFGVKKEGVAPHMRRLAKTLNFGMIYGMGYRALSQTAKIPPDQAKDFIKKYFEQFPSIRNWQAKVLESSRQSGVSSNINGRFRSVFSINSPNQFLASGAEREAVNMPTQSLAADVLKLAMIKVFDYAVQNGLSEKIKLILSIHDELIFEISQDLLKNGMDSPTTQKIKELMESSYKLDAPLKVDIKTGKKWGELK